MFQKEKTLETKHCKNCNISFDITDKDLEFYEKVSPVFNGQKYLIPTPSLCPECRRQRRLSWRNETKLYKRNCNFTGKSVVSIYSPDKDFITYNQDDWWSDKYNPFDYGIDFDFYRPFFDQYLDLRKKVPRITILNGFSENADYGNHSYYNKNSYFVCSCGYVEDCYYCTTVANSKRCLDCLKVSNSQICYECIDSKDCYNCFYVKDSYNCSDLFLCEDCQGTKYCIGCKGLKNKSYYILNRQVSKNEYAQIFDMIKNDMEFRNKLFLDYNKLKNSFPSKNLNIINSQNITNSDKIENSDQIYNCFECINSKNIKYCTEMMFLEAENNYDNDLWGENSSYIYEVHCTGNSKNILFSNIVWGGYNIMYCDNCLGTPNNCFGCIGLKGNEQYCILNKQYTKEEYEKLVPKIIEHMMKTGEWGEFFPSSISPFGYNETVAVEYFPLTKEDAKEKGFNWSDYESPLPKVDKIIPANMLPENIADIPDDILNWAIESELELTEGFSPLYRIIKQELEFYRKHNLPIPKRHPDQRHLDRMKLRNTRKLYDRKCDKCGVDMKTTYSPERPEIIYCESCYEKEVY
ncbi:MAG: hypothetical protein PHS49_02275 [Candidatus Gracilibacteria bacterium]|nr:hypothetical protein [Candidatus Gracilibacteria bacterium]